MSLICPSECFVVPHWKQKNDPMPKGALEGSWIIYLKIKASNVPIKHYFDKGKQSMSHILFSKLKERTKTGCSHSFAWLLVLKEPKSRNLLTYCQFSDTWKASEWHESEHDEVILQVQLRPLDWNNKNRWSIPISAWGSVSCTSVERHGNN